MPTNIHITTIMRKYLFLIIALLCVVVQGAWAAVGDIIASGDCSSFGGDNNVHWKLTENGFTIHDPGLTLNIWGRGEMENYSSSEPPWKRYRDRITNIVIDTDVTSIGSYAFYNCTNLIEVNLPSTLSRIGNYAFKNCTYLIEVYLPSALENIGHHAFQDCSMLTEIIIPASVSEIGNEAFYGCNYLKTVIFLPSEEKPTLGSNVFRDISTDGIIYVPSNYTFSGGSSLVFQHYAMSWVNGGTTFLYFHSFDNSQEENVLWVVKSGETGAMDNFPNVYSRGWNSVAGSILKVKIWPDVTTIGSYAFANFSKIQYLSIPDGLTAIGNYAFQGCSQLTSVNIPDNVRAIGEYTFKDCSSLRTISVPNNVSSIGNGAFQGCSQLTSVNISDNVRAIGEYTFKDCSSLRTIIIPNRVETIGNYAFQHCSELTDLYFEGTGRQWNRVTKGDGWNDCVSSSFKEHWLCSVNFFTEYGTAPATQTNLWSNEAKVTKPSDPTCEGYEFQGWHTDAAGTTLWDFANDIVPGDMTLYAGWVAYMNVYNNAANDLSAFDGNQRTLILTDRTLYCDGDWNTLCLPFSLASLTGTPLEGFIVKELDTETPHNGHVTGFDDGTLYLNFKDATSIEAGRPYIVKKLAVKDNAATPAYTATDGTAGTASEQGYANLIDGSTGGYRWRTSVVPAYCEFYSDQPVLVTGYTLTTGNQNVNGDPTVWTLSVSADGNEPWTVIDSRNANNTPTDALPSARTATSDVYNVQKPGTYQYFRFDVNATTGNSFLCLSELTLQACYLSDIANIENPTFKSVTVNSAEPTAVISTDGSVSFVGSFSPVPLTAGDKSVLFLGAANTLYYPGADMTVGSCRALFRLSGITAGDPASASIKEFRLNFSNEEDDATSLSEELRVKSEESNAAIYNLAGQRLQKLQKGINIIGGKKVLIK